MSRKRASKTLDTSYLLSLNDLLLHLLLNEDKRPIILIEDETDWDRLSLLYRYSTILKLEHYIFVAYKKEDGDALTDIANVHRYSEVSLRNGSVIRRRYGGGKRFGYRKLNPLPIKVVGVCHLYLNKDSFIATSYLKGNSNKVPAYVDPKYPADYFKDSYKIK